MTSSYKRIEYQLSSNLIDDMVKYNRKNIVDLNENIKGISLHILDVSNTIEEIQYTFSIDSNDINDYIQLISPNDIIYTDRYLGDILRVKTPVLKINTSGDNINTIMTNDNNEIILPKPLEIYRDFLDNYELALPNITLVYKELLYYKIIKIKCKKYLESFMKRYEEIGTILGKIFIDYIFVKCQDIINQYDTMSKNLEIMPTTIDEYIVAKNYLDDCRLHIQKINMECFGANGISEHQIYLLSNIPTKKYLEPLIVFTKMYNYQFDIVQSITKCSDSLLKSRMSICESLDGKRSNLSKKRSDIAKKISDLYSKSGFSISVAKNIKNAIEEIKVELCQLEVECNEMNSFENRMGQEVSNYNIAVSNMRSQLSLLGQIWTNIQTYFEYREIWYNKPFKDWNVSDCIKLSNQLYDEVQQFIIKVNNYPTLVQDLQLVRRGLESFVTKHRELALLLGIPGIKERHWDEIQKIIGLKFYHGPQLCLSSLIRTELDKYIDKLRDLIGDARGEYRVESSLEKMKLFWNNENYEVSSPNDIVNIPHLAGPSIKYIGETIEDQIVRCDLLLQDKYATLYENDIKKFARVVRLRQSSLHKYYNTQYSWMRYTGIFQSGNLKSFSEEVQQYYTQCESIYNYIILQAGDCKYWKDFLDDIETISKTANLQESLDLLEKSFQNYINSLREKAPRLYLLSNDQLSKYLTEKADKKAIKILVDQLFNGLEDIEQDEEEKHVIGMKCHSGEIFNFTLPFRKNTNITDMMINIQDSLNHSLKYYIHTVCKLQLTDICTLKTISDYNGQIILCAARIIVTKLIEDAFELHKLYDVSKLLKDCVESLIEIINSQPGRFVLLRVHQLLTYLRSMLLSCQLYIQRGILESDQFEWVGQMKSYLKNIDDVDKDPEANLKKKIITNSASIRSIADSPQTPNTPKEMLISEELHGQQSIDGSNSDLLSPTTTTAVEQQQQQQTPTTAGTTPLTPLSTTNTNETVESRPATAISTDTKTPSRVNTASSIHRKDPGEDDICNKQVVTISCMYHDMKYGYEHSPSYIRIVITPDILKYEESLYLSFYHHYKTIIHGDSVSGKYSVFENISNLLGYRTSSYHCSQDLTIPELYRLIGLATTGPFYVCFRNIEKLTNESLSTLGCVLQNIYITIKSRKTHIDLNGIPTKVNNDGQIVFTMSSSHPFLSLPESLQHHTRVLSVICPDFYHIASGLFFSYGFHNSKELGTKIASIFRHLSDYYPPVNNHTFNVRGMTTVISNAGYLHFLNPFMSDDDCLYDVLTKYIFSAVGTTLTDSILDMIRLEFNKCIIKGIHTDDSMKQHIELVSKENGIYASAKFIQTCLSLSQSIKSFNKIIISGHPGAGKTTYRRILLRSLKRESQFHGKQLNYRNIHPCTMSPLQWFGTGDQPGVLHGIKKFLQQSNTYNKQIICIDGTIDKWWLDSIPNIIYNKDAEESIVKEWNIVLETRTLCYASPALFNECAIIHTDAETQPKVYNLIESFFIRHNNEIHSEYSVLPFNPNENPKQENELNNSILLSSRPKSSAGMTELFSLTLEQSLYIRKIIEWLVNPTLSFLQSSITLSVSSQSEVVLVYNFLTYYESHLSYYFRHNNPYSTSEDSETNTTPLVDYSLCDMESIAIYCLTLAVRTLLDTENFSIFSHFFYLFLTDPNKAYTSYTLQGDGRYKDRTAILPYPENTNLFNYIYFPYFYWKGRRKSIGLWLTWDEIVNTMPMYELDPVHHQIIIPNKVLAMVDHYITMFYQLQQHTGLTFITPKSNGKSMALKYYLHHHKNDQVNFSNMNLHSMMVSDDLWSIFQRLFVDKEDYDTGIVLSSKNKRLIYIEDLHCLETAVSKRESAVGLLRELLDHKGWVRDETLKRQTIKDLKMIFTCSVDNNVCDNLLGINTEQVYLDSLSKTEVIKIYETILSPFFDDEEVPLELSQIGRLFASATFKIFESLKDFTAKCKSCDPIILSLKDTTSFFQIIYLYKQDQLFDCDELLRVWTFNLLQYTNNKLANHYALDYLLSKIEDTLTTTFHTNYFNLSTVNDNDEIDETNNLLNLYYLISSEHDDIKVKRHEDYNELVDEFQKALEKYQNKTAKPLAFPLFYNTVQSIIFCINSFQMAPYNIVYVYNNDEVSLLPVYCAGTYLNYEILIFQPTETNALWRVRLMTLLETVTHSTIPLVLSIDYSIISDNPGRLSDILELLSGHLPHWMLSNECLATLCALYQKVRGSLPPGMNSLEIVHELYQMARKNLRIVLCVPTATDFYQIIQTAPLIMKYTTLYLVKPYEYNDLCQIAYQYFLRTSVDSYYIESLCNVVTTIFLEVCESIPSLNELYPVPTISNFVSLLERYTTYLDIMKPERESKMEGLLLVVDSLSQIEQRVSDCQKKYEPVHKVYLEMYEKFKSTMDVYNSAEQSFKKYETIENDLIKLKAEREEEYAKVEAVYNKSMEPFMDKVKQCNDKCQKISKVDLDFIRNLFNVPAGISSILYSVIMIMNQQTYEKWDDTMKWEMVKDLLDNYEILIRIDKFDVGNIPKPVLEYLDKEYITQDVYSKEDRDFLPYPIQCIRDWMLVVVDACKEWWKHNEERDVIDKCKKELEEFQDKFMKNHKKYVSSKKIYEEISKSTQTKREEFNKIKDEDEELITELKNIKAFQDTLLGEMPTFEGKQQYLSTDIANIETNLLLSCCRVEFMGCMTEQERSRLYEGWCIICEKYDLEYTSNLSLIDFFDINTQVYQWNIEGIPSSEYITESMMIQGTCSQWCYFIDPLGIGIRWIQSAHTDREIVMLNGSDKALTDTVIESIRRGAVLVIGSVTEQNKSIFEPLLYHALFSRDKIQLKIENTIVDIHPDTMLYFYTDTNTFTMPKFLRNKVQIVNLSATHGLFTEPVMSLVLSYRNQKDKEKQQQFLQDIKQKYIDFTVAENNMYKSFSCLNNDFLAEAASIEELSQVKDKYLEKKKDYENVLQQYQNFVQQFESLIPIIENIAVIYQTLVDITPKDPWCTFNFDVFIHLFYKTLSEPKFKYITDNNIYDVLLDFTYKIYDYLAETTSLDIRLTCGLNLCLILYRYLDDYPLVAQNYIVQSYESNYQYEILPTVFISQIQYNTIQSASINIPEFNNLCEDIQVHRDIWIKIFNNLNPNLDLDLPEPYIKLQPFYKFLLWRIIKPQIYQEEVCYFIGAILDKPVSLYHEVKIDRKLVSIDLFTPILLKYNSQSNYPLDMLNELAVSNNKELIAKSPADIESVNRDIENAREQGKWLVLLDCNTFIDDINKLSLTGSKSSRKRATNRGYRLFIVTSSKLTFPYTFLRNVHQINIQIPRQLKSYLTYLFNKTVIKNMKLYLFSKDAIQKRLFYSLSVFHSMLLLRQLRFNENYYIGEPVIINDWYLLIQVYMKLIKYYKSDTETFFYTIYNLVCTIIYSSTHEIINGDTVQSIVHELYNRSISLEKCLLKSSSDYTVYMFPPSGIKDLTQYQNYIQNLPTQVTDTLLGIYPSSSNLSVNTPSQVLLDLTRTILAPPMRRLSSFGSHASEGNKKSNYSITPILLKEMYFSHIETYQFPLIELLQLSIHDLYYIQKFIMNDVIKYISNQDNRIITSFLHVMNDAIERNITPKDWYNLWEYNSKKASEYVHYLTTSIQYVSNIIGKHSITFDFNLIRWPIGVIEAMRHIYANKLQTSISNVTFKITPLNVDYDLDPNYLPVSLQNGFYVKSLTLYNCYFDYDIKAIKQPKINNMSTTASDLVDNQPFPTLLFTPVFGEQSHNHMFRVEASEDNTDPEYVIIPIYKDYGTINYKYDKALFYFQVPCDPDSTNWGLHQPYILLQPQDVLSI